MLKNVLLKRAHLPVRLYLRPHHRLFSQAPANIDTSEQKPSGFQRLTSTHLARRAMAATIEKQKEQSQYSQLTLFTKFTKFWLDAKRRFAYALIFYLIYHYDLPNRFVRWVKNKRASLTESYYNRWTQKYQPDLKVPRTRAVFRADPASHDCAMKQESLDVLAKLLYEVDYELQHGFSRELIATVLQHKDMQLQFGDEITLEEQPSELGQQLIEEKTAEEQALAKIKPLMNKE